MPQLLTELDSRASAYEKCAELPKAASLDDRINETEEEARMRRVGEFLQRRRPTGLLNGSASPTPPKDTHP